MKNSRKTIALLIASTGALCALVGCNQGTTSSSNGGKYEISFSTNRTDLDTDGTYTKYWNAFLAKNTEYAGSELVVDSHKNYEEDLKKAVSGKNYSDIVMIPEIDLNQLPDKFVSFGTVADLTATGNYRSEYLNKRAYDGECYGLAANCTVGGIVFNKKVFTAAGVDWKTLKTPALYLAAMESIKSKVTTCTAPLYTNLKDGWPCDKWEDQFQLGVNKGDADYNNNKLPFDKNVFKKGVSDTHYEGYKLFFDLVKNGCVESAPTSSDWETSKLKINNGEIGSMVLGSWAVSQMKAAGTHADDIGFMPFPMSASDGKQYYMTGGDYCYGINKNSDSGKITLAKKFVNYMIQESDFASSNDAISVWKAQAVPSFLSDWSGVTPLVAAAATSDNKNALSDIQTNSGITLYDSGKRFGEIVAFAKASDADTQFDAYMSKLNTKWAAAIK